MITWKVYSALVTTIVIIIGLLTIPIILFYAFREDDLNEWKETILESLTPHVAGCLDIQGNWSNSSACGANSTANASTVKAQLDCHPDFVQLCGVCTPRCATVDLNNRSGDTIRAADVSAAVAAVFGIIGFVVFLIMSIIRRKQMFAFPSILVVYEAVFQVSAVLAAFIGYIGGRDRLYCSHTDVVRTFLNPPTAYTTISGIVFQYGITTPFLFWVVHVGYMIALLQFPVFGNKKLRKRSVTITIHVVSVLVIFLFQLLWPVVTLSAFQYDIIRFPPFIGQAGNMDLLFYTVVVPAIVVGGSGIIMLVVLVFIIHKSLHSASELKSDFSKSKPKFFSAPEIKLLILSICFSIIGVVTVGTYSGGIGDQGAYAQRFIEYSNCLLCGNDPKCTMESTSDHFRVASSAIAQFAYSLLFAVNIMFTLNAADMSKISKVLCCACRRCKRSKYISATGISGSAPNPTHASQTHNNTSETVVMKFTVNSSSAPVVQ